MPRISFQQLQIITRGRQLQIAWGEEPEDAVLLQGMEIEELIDFLVSVRPVTNNQRQAFRIPLGRGAGIKAALRDEGGSHVPVRPRNISLTGILVEVPPNEEFDLPVGTEVQLIIQLEGEPQTYLATVKRRTASGYGLFFNDSMPSGRVDPPAALREGIMEVQRRWAAGRVIPIHNREDDSEEK